MAAPWWARDATDVAASIAAGEVTSAEVVDSVLERVHALNPALNAIVDELDDEARATAVECDRRRAAGESLGPLHGVPVTVKVNIDMRGKATTNGLAGLAGLIAPDDSPVVSNLRAAGAVVVGRTNAPELSMRLTTYNPLYGRTNNPWDPQASPGGSSGGAGAAAAAGFGTIHHGNDIGGSLRAPAFCNGVVTLKPSQGRVAAYVPSASAERGVLSQLMSSQGAICRSVADVDLATRVMAMPDPRDPWYVPVPFDGPPIDGPVRVAVSTNDHGMGIHPGIVELIDRAAGYLADAGYDVVQAEPPSVLEGARGWFSTGITEMQLTLDPVVRSMGSDELKEIFDRYYAMGELLDLAGYRAGFSERTRMMREWSVFLDQHPIVLSPYLLCPTFDWNGDIDTPDATKRIFDAAIWSTGINYVGLPAGVLPVDLVEGRPAGVQLIGRKYREDLVLAAMAAVEARAGRLIDRLWARETT